MSKKTPYRFWTKEELFDSITRQCIFYGFDIEEARGIVFSNYWNPLEYFDGCTLVEDPLHPFYPCLKHDYGWIVKGGGIEVDREFRRDLIKAGMYGFKAKVWFLGVRIGWFFWGKWTNKNNKK